MSEHDPNLITDLISGRLSPSERDEALEYIASDPALRSEYETQLATSSLLHDLPSPALTAEERSTLHASLRQQLHLDDAPALVVAPAPSRWQRWWAPVTGLAAAAVVIGVIVVLPSGQDESFEAISASLTETTAQASSDANSSDGGGETLDGAFADEQAAPTESAEAETTAAAEETTTTAASAAEVTGDAPPGALPHVPDGDLESIARSYGNDPDVFARGYASLTKDGSSDVVSDIDVCLTEASSAADTSVLELVATTVVDGAEAVVLSVTSSDGEPYLVALDLATCEELASTRP